MLVISYICYGAEACDDVHQISPTEIRGALGSVNQLFICIGILAALIAGLPLAANPLWYDESFLIHPNNIYCILSFQVI